MWIYNNLHKIILNWGVNKIVSNISHNWTHAAAFIARDGRY